jgi:hypothetical protein
MADKEPFESLTGIAQQTADQITQQTKVAMENYLTWFQNASQWANVDLNKKLLSYAAENVTNAVGLVQKLSQARKSGSCRNIAYQVGRFVARLVPLSHISRQWSLSAR